MPVRIAFAAFAPAPSNTSGALPFIASIAPSPGIETRALDLETGVWPFAGQTFDAIVVVHYLHRPLFPHLLAALAPDGALLYETFAAGNEAFGRPSNPEFLLRPGELLEAVRGRLDVLAYEQRVTDEPKRAVIQHIAARRR